jgi:hypothetical protein
MSTSDQNTNNNQDNKASLEDTLMEVNWKLNGVAAILSSLATSEKFEDDEEIPDIFFLLSQEVRAAKALLEQLSQEN